MLPDSGEGEWKEGGREGKKGRERWRGWWRRENVGDTRNGKQRSNQSKISIFTLRAQLLHSAFQC